MVALLSSLLLLVVLVELPNALVIAGDCPLDFSWANFTLAASTCAIPGERAQCCRYINAFVAISIAHYANATGKLGVPSAFSEICLNSVSETFGSYGIPTGASLFCGLGPKIQVSYLCSGRETVLEMMQSPNFADVISNCGVPLSLENNCRRCLNTGILYLHHLVGPENNIALSMCRDAVFVVLANQGGNMSPEDMASCFFGVKGLNIFPGPSSQVQQHPSPPSPLSIQSSVQNQTSQNNSPLKRHHNRHQLLLISAVGVVVIAVSVLLLLITLLLIHKKSKELAITDDPIETSRSSPPARALKCQDVIRCAEHLLDLYKIHATEEIKKVKRANQCLEISHEGGNFLFRICPSPMFRRFCYKETLKATKNLSTVIGKGGFGTVYKAEFSDGSIVAVKRMNKISKQGEEEFCREIELLARLHHRHLVALKGFCIKRNERFLVYEYMVNGCLKDHLHAAERTPLSWLTRLQIATDVANALEYLHFYCNPPLCHRDIKSSNILLDGNFVAKVADFGLAHASRSGAITFEPVNTDICGTPGYLDPEYVVTQELTEKSDIYSYGVLLLELLTGRRVIQDGKNIVEWSHKFLSSNSKLHELVDPAIAHNFDFEHVKIVVEIIKWCTHREGRARPSIKQVLRMLSECFDTVQCPEEGWEMRRDSQTRMQGNEFIPHSGDPRCLMSSSSTTRSYCSRSILLDTGSPQSPRGTFCV